MGGQLTGHQDLVDELVAAGVIHSKRLEKAFRQMDRRFFVNEAVVGHGKHEPEPAFSLPIWDKDVPLPLGCNQVMLSAGMHAALLELVDEALPGSGGRALDVGTGSGYMAAVMSVMAGAGSEVVAVELREGVHALACRCLECALPGYMKQGRLRVVLGDGLDKDVLSSLGDFDVIVVGAGCARVPQQLADLVRPGGRLIVPVGREKQVVKVFNRLKDGSMSVETTALVLHVQLITP